ncbi:hydrogenase [Pontimicrobium aquaticum]|uniref:Hydrogenase n=1 Tax=Pontimicrobium aquaticum TaxID=2565367 RepID=A0A4U0F105_9FLAO|nr:hydrogenase [Pontimicrobium aquaticum]TJY36312.1 hydrogenase [Pontimicrobium aquaticum]
MKGSNLIKTQSNKLIYLGVLLFFLGLIIGLLAPIFSNPRMAVSSHLEGVLNGMFLIVLGLIWNKIDLSHKWLKITFWLAIYGTFVNWFAILLAATFDAGKMLGIVANGKEGTPIIEGIITFSLISLSLAMLIICVTTLIGLRRNMK